MNGISRDRLESQREEREQAETEKEQVYSEFDDELRTLQERIDSLTQENEALRAENTGLHSKFGEMGKPAFWSWGMRETSIQGRSRSWCCQFWLMNWTVRLLSQAEEAMFFQT